MATRTENLSIVTSLEGIDPSIDDQVHDAISDRLGYDAFTDEALAVMAAEYRRLLETPLLPCQPARLS